MFRGTLLATVNAGGTLTLTTAAGKPVVSLRSGSYTFTVTDESKTLGFALSQLGKPATPLTASGFVGTRRVTVELAPGQWSSTRAASTSAATSASSAEAARRRARRVGGREKSALAWNRLDD